MPGCKFQDSWLSKDIYTEWLVKESQDVHFARCRVCCKAIKLQTMGEAALTSHARGASHKAALRKMREGKLLVINVPEQINGSVIKNEDNKDHVSISLQPDALDRGSEWSDLRHSPSANSHDAELQDAAFAVSYITSQGTSRIIGACHPSVSGSEPEEASHHSAHHGAARLTKLQHKQRSEALEQQMKILEWEYRMKMLAWEQELMREKKRAARQKQKAFRMKKAYYRAKLKRMGEEVPPSSSSSSSDDEEEKPSSHAG